MTKVVLNKTPTSITRFSAEAVDWLAEHGYEDVAEKIEQDETVERDNEGLVAVTEALGSAAGRGSCHPTIVEIPDDVEWRVSSKMQREIIVEEHRTWSP